MDFTDDEDNNKWDPKYGVQLTNPYLETGTNDPNTLIYIKEIVDLSMPEDYMRPVDENPLFLTCKSHFTCWLKEESKDRNIKCIHFNKITNKIYEHNRRIIVNAKKAYLMECLHWHHLWSNNEDNKKHKKTNKNERIEDKTSEAKWVLMMDMWNLWQLSFTYPTRTQIQNTSCWTQDPQSTSQTPM